MEVFLILVFIFIGLIVSSSLTTPTQTHDQNSKEKLAPNNESLTQTKSASFFRQKIRVVGVSYRNESGLSRQECIGQLSLKDSLWMEKDIDNTYDANALSVVSKYGVLGHVPRDLASKLIDIKQIKIIFISKGRAPNGLWGCTVEILMPNNNHKSHSPKEEEIIAEFKLEDGRAYSHVLLLQQLDSLAARVFTPDDDIKLTHASLGEGIITNIEARSDAKALLTVKYKMETCKHTSDIFSSSNISAITPVSMKASAINKYIDLLPNSKPYEEQKRKYYSTFSNSNDDSCYGLSESEISDIMYPEYDQDEFNEYDESLDGHDGIDSYWHDYHKHD